LAKPFGRSEFMSEEMAAVTFETKKREKFNEKFFD